MVRLTDGAPIVRDELMQKLLDGGISTRRGVMAIHLERPYCDKAWRLPVTTAVNDTTMILPLFHEMTNEEQDYVIDNLIDIGEQGLR